MRTILSRGGEPDRPSSAHADLPLAGSRTDASEGRLARVRQVLMQGVRNRLCSCIDVKFKVDAPMRQTQQGHCETREPTPRSRDLHTTARENRGIAKRRAAGDAGGSTIREFEPATRACGLAPDPDLNRSATADRSTPSGDTAGKWELGLPGTNRSGCWVDGERWVRAKADMLPGETVRPSLHQGPSLSQIVGSRTGRLGAVFHLVRAHRVGDIAAHPRLGGSIPEGRSQSVVPLISSSRTSSERMLECTRVSRRPGNTGTVRPKSD